MTTGEPSSARAFALDKILPGRAADILTTEEPSDAKLVRNLVS